MKARFERWLPSITCGVLFLSGILCDSSKEEYWDKPLPQTSRLAEVNETLNYKEWGDRWDYYDLSNIMYYNGEFLFFQERDEEVAGLPAQLNLNRYEMQMDYNYTRVHKGNRHKYPQKCKVWVEKPALLFASTGWDVNFYEHISNGLMPVFQAAVASGIFPLYDRFPGGDMPELDFEQKFLPEKSAPFILLGARPQAYESAWRHLWDYLTTEKWLLRPDLEGYCFKRLVVSEHGTLRFLYEHKVQQADPDWQTKLRGWMRHFQWFVARAEESYRKGLGHWPPQAVTGDWNVKRVVLISRKPQRAKARSILNEQEIVQFISNRYDCNVTVTDFRMPLSAAIQLMKHTHLLIGIHGAGLTNSFWLPEGAVVLQLIPYGWELKPGELIRSVFSADLAPAIGGHYRQWINSYSHNAHFSEGDFEGVWKKNWGPRPAFQAHPTDDLPKPHDPDPPPFWAFQNTWVDMPSFTPVLEESLQLAKIPRRQGKRGRGGR